MARRTTETWATGAHIHWEVRWVVKKGSDYAIMIHDCGNDLQEAMRVYSKLQGVGRRLVTLRSANVGFPPPEKYQPGWVTRKRKVTTKGRTRVKRVPILVVPMNKLNRRGIFWCPYCREMRKFQEQGGFYIEGVRVPEGGLYCPICGVSHRDFHVRKWNPIAERYYVNQGSGRRRRGRSRSRRTS